MERLTQQGKIFDKTILYEPSEYAYYTKKKSKVIDVRKIINKLGQFEDFMEEQGFGNLAHLDFTIEEQNKIIDAYEQENQALKDRWEKLVQYLKSEYDELAYVETTFAYPESDAERYAYKRILDKMQELENAGVKNV